jgi:hypothetical protein
LVIGTFVGGRSDGTDTTGTVGASVSSANTSTDVLVAVADDAVATSLLPW